MAYMQKNELWWRGTPHTIKKNNNMTKENLINRIKTKASSRKRLLFARYETLISSLENASIIVDEIHEDLGEDSLISVSDIYYCKRYFVKKEASKKKFIAKENEIIQQKNRSGQAMKWTDPNTIPRQILKSKFENSEE
jgi:hypothetical protein